MVECNFRVMSDTEEGGKVISVAACQLKGGLNYLSITRVRRCNEEQCILIKILSLLRKTQ